MNLVIHIFFCLIWSCSVASISVSIKFVLLGQSKNFLSTLIDTQKSDDSNHYQSTTKKSVHFENNQLQHSVSVPESVLSWQDSSFEQSLDDRVMAKTSDGNKNGFEIAEKELDGKYHKLRAIKSTTERIFNSAKNEQKVSKALFGALAGFVIGGLLYLVLVFSYGYSYLVAGIIDAVATVFFILCLAFCPLCRCVMALVFPNFFTGKGRAVFLSIIFGVMLSHPIANISLNIQEASKSMACVTELAANQTRALQKQFAQPVSEVTTYVENEKDNLKVIYSSMKLSFSGIETALEELDKQVDTAKKAVLSVKEVNMISMGLYLSSLKAFI